MFNKKAQQAMEFMVIFIFVFIIIAIVTYVAGVYIVDAQDQDSQNMVDNFAKNIENEIEILGKVESGYYRELEIYDKNYYIEINNSYLFIEDLWTSDIYYYEIKGNYSIKVFNRTSIDYGDIRVISFEK